MQDPDLNALDASLAANGGRAFPSAIPAKGGTVHAPGMSLRDWFAGQALAGLASSWVTERPGRWEKVAEEAYGMADALLSRRAENAR